PADCPSIRGSIAVTAVMGTRIPCLTGVAAERVPAAIVRCAANFSAIDTATVVRESVVRNECDAHERCGREAEGQVAQHGHLLSWRSFLPYHGGECFTPCLRQSEQPRRRGSSRSCACSRAGTRIDRPNVSRPLPAHPILRPRPAAR